MAFILVRGAVDPNGDLGKSVNDKGATMGGGRQRQWRVGNNVCSMKRGRALVAVKRSRSKILTTRWSRSGRGYNHEMSMAALVQQVKAGRSAARGIHTGIKEQNQCR